MGHEVQKERVESTTDSNRQVSTVPSLVKARRVIVKKKGGREVKVSLPEY